MQFRKNHLYLVFGLSALVGIIHPAVVQAKQIKVTFTVPVQIQNIHSDWAKVAVYCGGAPAVSDIQSVPPAYVMIGEIDVSNRAQGSISQTITGTVDVSDSTEGWSCVLRIQHSNESMARPPRNYDDVKFGQQPVVSKEW